jgi:hypothetical protein
MPIVPSQGRDPIGFGQANLAAGARLTKLDVAFSRQLCKSKRKILEPGSEGRRIYLFARRRSLEVLRLLY